MRGDILSPPAKRPSPYFSAAMPDPSSNGPFKRPKQPQPPLHVPPGYVVFRLICHASRIGGVIGKSGSIIKQLQQSTGAKIRIEDPPPDSQDRVVTVMSSAAVTSKISLSLQRDMNPYRTDGDGEFEVSQAQEALVRVFERVLEVAAESDGLVVAGGMVSCRVLAEKNQAGSVIGKGGKVVEQIRKESGCKIRILKDNLPTCASAGDEMIEIEGNVLGVKKALIATSRCLQDCIPVEKGRTSGSRHFEAVSHQPLPEFHVDLPQINSTMPARTTSSISYASGVDHLAVEIDRMPTLEAKAFQQDIVYKILCPSDRVGGVIGKGGSIVRALQNETGASISVGPSIAGCDERVIIVTASENQETRFSPAQKAAVLVFARSVDAANEKAEDSNSNSSKGNSVVARLLVPSKQVGCLLGKGGVIISEIRRATGAYIRILVGDQVPMCASENEEVAQISGDFSSVQDALYNVTGRLRDNTLSSTPNNTGIRSSYSLPPETSSPYGNLKDTTTTTAHHGLPSLSAHHSYNTRHSNLAPTRTDHFDNRHSNLAPTRMDHLDTRHSNLAPTRTDHLDTRHSNLAPTRTDHLDTRHSNLAPTRTDHLDYAPLSVDNSSSSNFWESPTSAGVPLRSFSDIGRGLTSLRGGAVETGGGSKSAAIVTNTTVEISVPEEVIHCVYGDNGSNLNRLRQISGAKVIVHEPLPGQSERRLVISGSPDQTQAAQSLLHAFILTG